MRKMKLVIERYYPLLSTIVLCFILLWKRELSVLRTLYASLFDSTFLTAVLTSLSIIFGFLLTSFSTIYTSKSDAVMAMRREKRFSELVSYNKQAVLWTFCSVILTSIFLLSFQLEYNTPYYDYFVAFWVFCIIFAILLSFRFLNLFYLLI